MGLYVFCSTVIMIIQGSFSVHPLSCQRNMSEDGTDITVASVGGNCSLPLWRVHEIRRMYLASRTHGLFITKTQFRSPYYSSCWFFVTPPSIFPLLTWKPSFGVMRSRPPWPQVVLNCPPPSHPFPIPSPFQIPDPQRFSWINCFFSFVFLCSKEHLFSLYSIWVWRREPNPHHSSVYHTPGALAHWNIPGALAHWDWTPELIVRLTKTTSRSRLPRSGTDILLVDAEKLAMLPLFLPESRRVMDYINYMATVIGTLWLAHCFKDEWSSKRNTVQQANNTLLLTVSDLPRQCIGILLYW